MIGGLWWLADSKVVRSDKDDTVVTLVCLAMDYWTYIGAPVLRFWFPVIIKTDKIHQTHRGMLKIFSIPTTEERNQDPNLNTQSYTTLSNPDV